MGLRSPSSPWYNMDHVSTHPATGCLDELLPGQQQHRTQRAVHQPDLVHCRGGVISYTLLSLLAWHTLHSEQAASKWQAEVRGGHWLCMYAAHAAVCSPSSMVCC